MRLRVISLFTLLEVYSLIGSSFSSIFLKFGQKDAIKEYDRLKNESVYRGIFLSLSPAEKLAMCEDIFSDQLYINSDENRERSEQGTKKVLFSDSPLDDKQEFPISVSKTAASQDISKPKFFSSLSEAQKIALCENYFNAQKPDRNTESSEQGTTKVLASDTPLDEKPELPISTSKDTTIHDISESKFYPLSTDQKQAICEDVLRVLNFDENRESSEQGTKKLLISDSFLEDTQEFPISVRKIAASNEIPELKWDVSLGFKCVGRYFKKKESGFPISHHIFSAFQSKCLYSASRAQTMADQILNLSKFITLSPDHVQLEQSDLEKYYVNTRVRLMDLRQESPEYVDLIEQRADLLVLSKFQKFILCALILSSPVYRKERLKFSLDGWITLGHVTKELSLERMVHPKEPVKVECILCKALKGTEQYSYSVNMYLTHTYDDKYSVIVLKEHNRRVYVDKYFKNIALLLTLFAQMDFVELIPTYT